MPGYPAADVLVAFSGGLDSTVLLAALAQQPPAHLRALHVHHGLHADATRWSAHCRRLAARLQVPLKIVRVKVTTVGVSPEEAARECRYAAFARALDEGAILLTAHHEDDQLETVLLQLFRGAGVAGLAAMPQRIRFAAGWHVRPLLSRSRQELQDWAKRAGLTWVEDATNSDERWDRNYLRRQVLPLIRARWRGVGVAVGRSARHAAEAQRLLDGLAQLDVARAAVGKDLSLKVLRTLQPDRRRNALRYWLARAGLRVPDTRRLEQLVGPVISARGDANPRVSWGGAQVQRHNDLLCASALTAGAAPRPSTDGASVHRLAPEPEIRWEWLEHPQLTLPDGGMLELQSHPHGPIDLAKLHESVIVRWRRGGEALRPRRSGPRRSLKRLLQESHLPLAERASLPLLFMDGVLVAAADLWLDAAIQYEPDSGAIAARPAPARGKPAARGRLRWHLPRP